MRAVRQAARQPWTPKMVRPLERNMLDLDPPDHTRLRGLVHTVFTPRLIEQMRERIQRLTNDLVDAVERRGRMDLIRDYALPVPTTRIRAYQDYVNSFSRAEVLKRPVTYAIISVDGNFDFTDLDRWYERDGGEQVGRYILYRLKLRD